MAASGIIIVNKPAGKTSRWVTTRVGRLLKEKKAGHLGTLDPIATGVLPVVLGRATRLIRFLESDEKIYQGTIRLGQATDTQDAVGEVVEEGDWRGIDPAAVTAVVSLFQGEILQVPPMHSAVKKDGKPLYKLARQGIEVRRDPRRVKVYSLIVESIALPDVRLRARCAPGTYMRTLANDIGKKLGCGAHLKSLVRLASGPFSIGRAVDLEGLDQEAATNSLIPMAECLPHFPAVQISESQARMVRDGVSLSGDAVGQAVPGRRYRLLRDERLVAVAAGIDRKGSVVLRPLRVLG